MDIELVEIRDFLAAHSPFDALPPEVLDRLPAALGVRYLRRGSAFPPPQTAGRFACLLRSGAVEMRDARGELVDKLGEGDLHSGDCGEGDTSAVAAEDCLLYLVPCDRLEQLRREHAQFARHFDSSLVDRLRRAIDTLRHSPAGGARLLSVEVRSLITRPPVFVAPGTPIRDAARRMAAARVSSLLILEGEALVGLVTDRDLRSRCLAAGLDPARPVREIMTGNVQTIPASTPGFGALMRMTQLNVHHLPVSEGERILGVVTTTDLLRLESASAVFLVGDVHKAPDLAALEAIASRVPELHVQLALAGASARNVGEAVSAVADALTQRLIALAEAELGAPPAAYAWVAGGSQARREQTSHGDQDNALILAADATPGDDAYFASLARFVNDGLAACGFTRCPGEVMASNPKWRQPVAQWERHFAGWIETPEPMALMLSSVFFDLRVVHGEASLLQGLQEANLARTKGNGFFLARLADNALANRPPLGFFRNLVLIRGGEHDRTFNLKLKGVVPIVDLARVHALAEGRPEINTIERLRAAAGSATVSAQGAENLEDAFEFVSTLRVQHQARQLRAGLAPDNFIAPEALSALDRSHLKDAFGVIATMQQTLESRYPFGRHY